MTGLLHLYAFIVLVLVILVVAWIAMILHADEDPPPRGSAPAAAERRDRAGDERTGLPGSPGPGPR
jgi:hypothetical protein